jgi:hypothetical protein
MQRDVLLDLAKSLGNVSEACRRMGVDRSAYYRALRRRGRAGEARSPLAKPAELERKLISLCLEFPEWGCDKLAIYLTLNGDSVSSPTVQKILIRQGLGRVAARKERAAGRQSH